MLCRVKFRHKSFPLRHCTGCLWFLRSHTDCSQNRLGFKLGYYVSKGLVRSRLGNATNSTKRHFLFHKLLITSWLYWKQYQIMALYEAEYVEAWKENGCTEYLNSFCYINGKLNKSLRLHPFSLIYGVAGLKAN